MASMSITLDTSRSPILRVIFEGETTEAEMRAHLAQLTQEIRSRPLNALIYDARRSGAPTALQRQLQAAWMRENESTIRARNAGVAFVIDSAIIRGALTAILWIQPMATEHTVVATLEDAQRWCADQLRKKDAKLGGQSATR